MCNITNLRAHLNALREEGKSAEFLAGAEEMIQFLSEDRTDEYMCNCELCRNQRAGLNIFPWEE